MKIFLTEYQVDDKIYAGFNIFAESLDEAEYVADLHGLTLVGEVVKITCSLVCNVRIYISSEFQI